MVSSKMTTGLKIDNGIMPLLSETFLLSEANPYADKENILISANKPLNKLNFKYYQPKITYSRKRNNPKIIGHIAPEEEILNELA